MDEDGTVVASFDEEFVGVPVPPDGSRYQVIRDRWTLDQWVALRQIFEYRLMPAELDEA